MKCSLGISNFLEEISSLPHSIVSPLFLCIDCWGRLSYLSWLFFGTLHSNGNIFPFLFRFSLLFFSQLFERPPQTAVLLFCISFSWRLSWVLPPVQCHKPLSIFLQGLCLSDLVPWIYFSLPLYNHKGFDLGHKWQSTPLILPGKLVDGGAWWATAHGVAKSRTWLSSFTLNGGPFFFNLSLNLAIRSSWSEPQSTPSLVFADYIELLHLWLQRI